MSDSDLTKIEAYPVANTGSPGKEYGLGVLKGIIGAIPYVGPLFNEILFDARSRVMQRRLEQFVGELSQEVAQLKEEKIDHSYLQSDEFSDLLGDVAHKVAKTQDTRKFQYFRNVLLRGLQGQRTPDFGELYLSLLHEITVDELGVFSEYADAFDLLQGSRAKGVGADMKMLDYTGDAIQGYPIPVYRVILQSLIRKGLLYDNSYGRMNSTPYTFVEATDLGAQFYKWLKG